MQMPRVSRSWFIASTLGAFVVFGCAEETGKLTTEPELEPSRMLVAVQERDFGPALAAQARHMEALMRLDGVVGTGVGVDENGEPAIKVFTLTDAVRGIPDRVDGIPVRRLVTGMFVAGDVNDPTTRERPAPNGFSIGHTDITAGTLGAIVGDGTTCFILSNNHVLANSNQATLGDNSLQPGPFDGGTSADAIGSLAAFKPISFNSGTNDIDAAISTIFSTNSVTAATPSYGAPGTGYVSAVVGQSVQKFGRTTGHTVGLVAEVSVTVNVCYETRGPFRCKSSATFVDQFTVTPGTFSGGGDSGSLIVANVADARPVGLLFAGSSTRTIGNPIENVLGYFNVTIQPDLTNCGSGEPLPNSPPTADFTFTTTDLTAAFTDASTDSDGGSVVTWAWEFGDGNTSTAQNPPSHTYTTAGTYTVTLTVTDNDGATDNTSQDVDVTVSDPAGAGFSLSATGYKVRRGLQKADLAWSGATSTNVDVFRDGGKITTTANDGFYTDNINNRGGGSYTYQVCVEDTPTCSNEAIVTF